MQKNMLILKKNMLMFSEKYADVFLKTC